MRTSTATMRTRPMATTRRNAQSQQHDAVIEEFFFIKVLDVYTPVSLSVVQDYTQESLNVNQSDSNILTLNPYLVFHPTKRTTLNTGYQYRISGTKMQGDGQAGAERLCRAAA